ncbi:MAG: FG-GAP-like repeat-containing protein [Phycisphaerales bacterium]
MNNDSLLDLVATGEGNDEVVWYQNLGGSPPEFSEPKLVTNSVRTPLDVIAADLDNDLDLDLVVCGAGTISDDLTIVWIENDGTDDPWSAPPVTIARGGAHADPAAIAKFVRSVHVDDINGDGLPDLLAAAQGNFVITNPTNPGAFVQDGGVQLYISQGLDAGGDPVFPTMPIVMETTAFDVQDVDTGDFNNDGLIDIVAGYGSAGLGPNGVYDEPDGDDDNNKVAWYQNLGGLTPTFAPEFRVADEQYGIISIVAADLDGDGFDDIVSTAGLDNRVIWFPNTDGSGAYELITPASISSEQTPQQALGSVGRPWSIDVEDIDGDGDLDVVSANRDDDNITLFSNDGAAVPSFVQSIGADQLGDPFAVIAADLDGDGDIDLASASRDSDAIRWHEAVKVVDQTTLAEFGTLPIAIEQATPGDTLLAREAHFAGPCLPVLDFLGKQIAVESRDISPFSGVLERGPNTVTLLAGGSVLRAASGQPARMFGELWLPSGQSATIDAATTILAGRLDLPAGSTLIAVGSIEVSREVVFSETVISGTVRGPGSVAVQDFTQDGNPDILLAAQNSGLVWLYVHDSGSPPSFSSIPLAVDAPRPTAVTSARVDSDGLADAIYATWGTSSLPSQILWLKNSGDPLQPFPTSPAVIDAAFPQVGGRGIDWLHAADLDADGDVDLVASGSRADRIAWYQNDGQASPNFARSPLIAADGVVAVVTADIDLDDDVDLVAALRDGSQSNPPANIVWIPSDGAQPTPAFGSLIAIDVAFPDVHDAIAVDLDDDGDIDVAAVGGETIAWYRNNGQDPPSFEKQVVTAPAVNGASSIRSLDADGDGDLDLVVASREDDKVRWFENDGQPDPSFSERLAAANARSAVLALPSDIDRDGFIDFVVAGFNPFSRLGSDSLTWLKNGAIAELPVDQPNSQMISTADIRIKNKSVALASSAAIRAQSSIEMDDRSTLLAAGTLDAPTVTSNGEIRLGPGDAPSITGNYVQAPDSDDPGIPATGRLSIDLGDGSQVPLLQIDGSADLGGSLVVTAAEDFDPELTEYVIVRAGAPIGNDRFDVAFLPPLPPGKFFRVEYDRPDAGAPGSVTLVVDVLRDDIELTDPAGYTSDGAGAPPSAATFGQFDLDPREDLALVFPDPVQPNELAGQIVILRNARLEGGLLTFDRSATTSIPTPPAPSGVAFGDVNGDGGGDVVVVGRANDDLAVYIRTESPEGPFPSLQALLTTTDRPAAVAMADLDGDGLDDIAVAGSSPSGGGEVRTRLNQSSPGNPPSFGAPASIPIGGNPRALLLVNLDSPSSGNPLPDLVALSDNNDEADIYRNAGGGTGSSWGGFSSRSTVRLNGSPNSADTGDLDNDGDLDIAMTNLTNGSVTIILNVSSLDEGFSFASAVDLPVAPNPTAIAIADLDSDVNADQDIAVIADSDSGDRVVYTLRNDLDSEGNLIFTIALQSSSTGTPKFLFTGEIDDQPGDDLLVVNEVATEGARTAGDLSASLFGQLNASDTCPADLDGNGTLNFDDIDLFVNGFLAGDLIADLDGNGTLNFDDIDAFVAGFLSGCP